MPWPFSLLWSRNSESDKNDIKDTEDTENNGGTVTEAVSSTAKEVADATPSPTDLLRHFEQSGVALPPGARVGDPKLKQREQQPMSLWQLGKVAAFGAAKGEPTWLRGLLIRYEYSQDEC